MQEVGVLTKTEKIQMVASRQWFHSIDLGDGIVTPGRIKLSHLRQMLEYLSFPENFEGLNVLDIGAWDGFFSFEAERRGAKRVVALDLDPPQYTGLGIAQTLLQSKVEFMQGSVYELSPDVHGTFDIVLFLGVFYHLRYPLLALDRISQVTKHYVLMETSCMENHLLFADRTEASLAEIDKRLTEVPLYRFYRNDELNPGDFSNWFSPNQQAVEDALWTAGFRPEFLSAWGDRIAYKGVKLSSIPEYLLETYEGVRWLDGPDGKKTRFVLQRNQNDQPYPQTVVPVTLPGINPVNLQVVVPSLENDPVRLRSQISDLQKEISALHSQIGLMRNLIQAIRRTVIYRLLTGLGRWQWFKKTVSDLQLD